MLGAIYGDILGSTFEFKNTNDPNFILPGNSSYTDDTIMAVAIAEAFLTNSSYEYCLRKWCHKYSQPMGGYGANFKRWLKSSDPKPYKSWGNGAVTRMMAIPWLTIRDNSVKHTKASAEITHNSNEALQTVEAVTDLMRNLLPGEGSKDCVKTMTNGFKYTALIPEAYQEPNWYNNFCSARECTQAALAAFYNSNSFEEAVRLAISFGGDSDSIGAIAGGIAECYYMNRQEIYDFIEEYLPQDMLAVVKEFYEESEDQIGEYKVRQ
jgi:ADP-ribosylglycohydrolase